MWLRTNSLINTIFFSINILVANLAISGTIYGINADNDALISFDTSTGETQSVQSFSFYSQGQATYDILQDKIFVFDANNDKIISYDLGEKSTSDIIISNDANQVLSVFGVMIDGTFIATTDDFSESDSTAKRFAEISSQGAVSRIGTPLVTGSEYPQGNQHYVETSNSIYTISGNSAQKLSVLDLSTNTAKGFASAVTSIDGVSADGKIIYGRDTLSDPHQILKVDSTTETTSVLVASPPSGYDSLGSAFIDNLTNELTVKLGKSGGSGIATYDLTSGDLKKLTDTSSINQSGRVGRFVNTTLAVNVSSGETVLSENVESSIGSLLKLGEGTLNVTGDSSSSGGTYVEEGTLKINGSFESSSAEISADATLGGAGTVASIVNDGTVAPGNSIGTLNVSGSVVLNSGSVLVIEVDANGNSDKIVATGAVTAGGTLRISPESGSYTDGQQYTIITGSSVSGTFANISVLSCSGTATPTYGSTSITFSLSNCSLSRPTNISTIISYINDLDTSSSADLQSIVTAINNLTGTDYEAAVATLDANSQTNIRASSVQQISTINSLINQRASGGLDNVTNIASLFSGADTQSNLAITTRGDEHSLARSNEPWIKTFIANSKQNDDTEAGINGYDFQAGGFVIGYDVRKNTNLQGLAFSYIDGKTTSNNSEGSSDQKTMVLSGYRVNELGNGSMLSTSLSLVLNDITSSRKIAFTGINRTASASYDALGFDVSTSYTSAPKQRYGGDASTEISFGVFSSQNDAYTETGAGAANLTVDSFASTMGRLGVKEKIVWKDGFDWLSDAIPYASFGINVSSELTAGTASQALSGQSKFVSKTDNGANTDIELGVGFNKKFQNNGVLSSGVTARVGSGFNSQEANLTYRWQF